MYDSLPRKTVSDLAGIQSSDLIYLPRIEEP